MSYQQQSVAKSTQLSSAKGGQAKLNIYGLLKSKKSVLSKNKWGIPQGGLFCENKGAKRRVANEEDQLLASSLYNVPQEGEKNFWKKVSLNGSGLTNDGKKVTYYNRLPHLNIGTNGEVCDGKKGSVPGSGGLCLTPFFSIAADLKYYSIGDIICVNELKDKSFVLPKHGLVKHSGCFIVGDKGSAIKGENRFDFFVGTAKSNAKNPFKELMNKKSCRHSFSVVRVGSVQWVEKIKEIEASMNYGTSSGALLSRYAVAHSRANSRRIAMQDK